MKFTSSFATSYKTFEKNPLSKSFHPPLLSKPFALSGKGLSFAKNQLCKDISRWKTPAGAGFAGFAVFQATTARADVGWP